MICSVPGCGKPVRARGWCATHHQRWRVRGDVNVVLRPWDIRQRKNFWEHVDKAGPVPLDPWWPVVGGCWIWTGYLDRNGYGWLGGVPAHRIAYESLVGVIPPGWTIDHLCRVHACVNPEHLSAVTRAENARRGPNTYKSHCPAGHPYDEANTYINGRGGRICRACNSDRYHARKRAIP